MSEEAKKETLTESPYRIASPEFFFLLQRIDRLDEKLIGEISRFRQEVREEISELRQEMKKEISELRQEMQGEVSELRQEMKKEISELRQEMQGMITELGHEVHQTRHSFTVLEWTAIIGFIAVIASIFVAPLFK